MADAVAARETLWNVLSIIKGLITVRTATHLN